MFARHYLRNLGWFLFLELLRCFSSLGSPPFSYIFRDGYPCGWVSPFGHFRIKAYLPAPRNFTQAITSFIACNRQGIHHMHLFTWSYNVNTWTLFKSSCRDAWDVRYRFSKATLYLLQGCTINTGLFHLHLFKNAFVLQQIGSWNSCEQNVSILQSITTHLDTATSSQSCVSSLLLPFC